MIPKITTWDYVVEEGNEYHCAGIDWFPSYDGDFMRREDVEKVLAEMQAEIDALRKQS